MGRCQARQPPQDAENQTLVIADIAQPNLRRASQTINGVCRRAIWWTAARDVQPGKQLAYGRSNHRRMNRLGYDGGPAERLA